MTVTEDDKLRVKMVYESYHRDIFNLAIHILGKVEDAEDVVQEVFIRYSRKMRDMKADENPKWWLIRVAVNLCIDRKRYLARFLKSFSEIFDFHNKAVATPESEVIISDSVRNVLDSFSRKERVIIILKYMEDFEYSEISEIMNIPVGTLKSITSRAIKDKEKGKFL